MTKRSHLISATLSFAVPIAIFFGVELRDAGRLSLHNFLLLVAIALGFGWLAAISMWNVWLKKKVGG
jgi:hypothetical protein